MDTHATRLGRGMVRRLRTTIRPFLSSSVRSLYVIEISQAINTFYITALTPDPSLTGDHVVLAYVITLAEHQLNTDLHVTNASPSAPLSFQALLHTYIRAPAGAAHIDGLQNLTYLDKTVAGNQKLRESRAIADVQQYTDFVYENAPGEYTVTWPDGGLKVKAIKFKDVVLWNPGPQKGKEIGDMEEGGW